MTEVMSLAGIFLGNYQVLFVVTSALRVPGLVLLRRIHEPDAEPSLVMVRQVFLLPNGRRNRRRAGSGRR